MLAVFLVFLVHLVLNKLASLSKQQKVEHARAQGAWCKYIGNSVHNINYISSI